MLAHCYFDMLDVCISVDIYGTKMELPNAAGYIVSGGTYILPPGIDPLGLTADVLYGFAARPLTGLPY